MVSASRPQPSTLARSARCVLATRLGNDGPGSQALLPARCLDADDPVIDIESMSARAPHREAIDAQRDRTTAAAQGKGRDKDIRLGTRYRHGELLIGQIKDTLAFHRSPANRSLACP